MVFTLIQCSNLKMAGRGRQSIDYMKPKEPSFLAKFKREIGYKEGPTVESKKANLPLDDEDDRPDADDEQPLVVVLKDGDLTKEEYEAHKKATGSHGNQSGSGEAVSSGDDASSTLLPGKLTFKKPAKRKEQESSRLQFSSSKKKKDKEKSKQSTKGKKVKNASLLSFDDEEDEET